MEQNKGSLHIRLLVLETHLPSNLRIVRVEYIDSIVVGCENLGPEPLPSYLPILTIDIIYVLEDYK